MRIPDNYGMEREGYKEYEHCGTLPSKGESTYVDISRNWLGDFMWWLHRRYIQHVQN